MVDEQANDQGVRTQCAAHDGVADQAQVGGAGALRSGQPVGSHHWQAFLSAYRLVPSKSRRGNCHDNVEAESVFQLFKHEWIKGRIYADRAEARADVFDCIEMFYNPKRRHCSSK
jgi:transposase InsO family protein